MFADSFLGSLFPGSLSYLVTPFTCVSLDKEHNFYLVLTACHLSPKKGRDDDLEVYPRLKESAFGFCLIS